MFFKNVRPYRVVEALDLDALAEALTHQPARPCGSLEAETLGFWPPLGRGAEQLIHVTNGRAMMCARKYERVLPSQAVREVVDQRVHEIEQKDERRVGRGERKSMTEEVTQRMLPNAPQKPKDIYFYYDPRAELIAVDISSEKTAADILSLLRNVLGSLRVAPIRTNTTPWMTLTGWVAGGEAGTPFALGDEVVMEEPGEDGAKGKFSHHDLGAETIGAHIEAGMIVAQLGLRFDNRMSCMIDGDLTVTKLRFEDIVTSELADTAMETEAERFDAEFALMAGEVDQLLRALIAAFGGEPEDETREAA